MVIKVLMLWAREPELDHSLCQNAGSGGEHLSSQSWLDREGWMPREQWSADRVSVLSSRPIRDSLKGGGQPS